MLPSVIYMYTADKFFLWGAFGPSVCHDYHQKVFDPDSDGIPDN